MRDHKKPKWTRWHGGFRLDLSAVEIEGAWYPEFAISRCDGFELPWQRPIAEGRPTEADALNLAALLAIHEADFWRATALKVKLP
jgi:hypothetical protein